MDDDRGDLGDAVALMKRAAFGELAAQRGMIDWALSRTQHGATFEDATALAEFWGRVAVCHGEELDQARMLSLLALRAQAAADVGDLPREKMFLGEGIAIADELANSDSEMGITVGGVLDHLVRDADPEVIGHAKAYGGMFK